MLVVVLLPESISVLAATALRSVIILTDVANVKRLLVMARGQVLELPLEARCLKCFSLVNALLATALLQRPLVPSGLYSAKWRSPIARLREPRQSAYMLHCCAEWGFRGGLPSSWSSYMMVWRLVLLRAADWHRHLRSSLGQEFAVSMTTEGSMRAANGAIGDSHRLCGDWRWRMQRWQIMKHSSSSRRSSSSSKQE